MTPERLRELLRPFVAASTASGSFEDVEKCVPGDLYEKLAAYLELLLRWNARTNLTAIREPEEIVTRHFGEGVFAGLQLQPYLHTAATLLDFGSGAGFPGLPIQLVLPDLSVTLAESQGKKASFLREAVRVLELRTEVWPARVEAMPDSRRFHVVTLRAVDGMADARVSGAARLLPGGILAELTSTADGWAGPAGSLASAIPVPLSSHRVLAFWRLRLEQ